MKILVDCGNPAKLEIMKWILLFTFLYGTIAFSQTNIETNNRMYHIEEYQIYPGLKVVFGKKWTGGNTYTYAKEESIDYQNTCMIFCGHLHFKEGFPVKSDLSSLQLIHHSIGYENNYSYLFSPTEEVVYVLRKRQLSAISVKGLKHVKGLIFKDKSKKLYFIPSVGGYNFYPISMPVDETELQHVAYDFYTDKNGLYYFDRYGKGTQMLESSNGKVIHAIPYENYLVYGDAAYSYGGGARLNASSLRTIRSVYGSYLIDGATHPTLGSLIKKGLPEEPMNEWNCFDILVVGQNRKGNTLYYPSKEIYAGGGSYYTMIETSKNRYGITGSSNKLEVVKFDDVMIYNLQTDKYESMEIDKFKRLTVNVYIYKGQMYYSNSEPVEMEGVDIEKLHPITLHGKPTEFYTDGKTLLGGYNLGKMKIEERGKHKWRIFTGLFRQVDWDSLHIVSEYIMMDKNNIYQVNNTILEVIPIKTLGLPVLNFKKGKESL